MPDFFRFVFVQAGPGFTFDDVLPLRQYTWRHTALARWSEASQAGLPTALSQPHSAAHIAVLGWFRRNQAAAQAAAHRIRQFPVPQPIPLLIIEEPANQGVTAAFIQHNPPAVGLLHFQFTAAAIAQALQTLGIVLPPPTLRLVPLAHNLAIQQFIQSHGQPRLALIIQKFFPTASSVQLHPVQGGWSGDSLCRLYVDGDPTEYFLKLFDDKAKYSTEFLAHQRAYWNWLRAHLVELVPVPQLDPHPSDAQAEAFPPVRGAPALYPICYKSASTYEQPRKTWWELYETLPAHFQDPVLKRLLKILEQDNSHPQCLHESPWLFTATFKFQAPPGNNSFVLGPELQLQVLLALEDLDRYGDEMCLRAKQPSTAPNWSQRSALLQQLLFQTPPNWLSTPAPVSLGHIHGDPNPRNCMVNPAKLGEPDRPDEVLQLIDCGGYRPQGRLVSDLALLERDIKLVLMERELAAHGYRDLDVHRLARWCRLERDLARAGLDFQAPPAPSFIRRLLAPISRGAATDSLVRRLVARTRRRAAELSRAAGDPTGIHYFAALLYHTLAILKQDQVRRSKKLLALYSASEILAQFP